MLRFESPPSSPVGRRSRITLKAILASAVLGCFVLPLLLAPDGLVLGMANSTQIAEASAPIPEPSVLSQTTVAPNDDASPLVRSSAEVDVDKADLRTAESSSVTDQGINSQVDLKSRADAATFVTSEDVARPATPEAVAAPTPQAVPRDVPTGGEESSRTFQEFLRWRAAHSTEVAGPGQKPKKKRNNTVQVVGPLATAISSIPARPRENRPRRLIPPSAPVESTRPGNTQPSSVR
jgi:hypothetical protein